jgi:hypothetical protein
MHLRAMLAGFRQFYSLPGGYQYDYRGKYAKYSPKYCLWRSFTADLPAGVLRTDLGIPMVLHTYQGSRAHSCPPSIFFKAGKLRIKKARWHFNFQHQHPVRFREPGAPACNCLWASLEISGGAYLDV